MACLENNGLGELQVKGKAIALALIALVLLSGCVQQQQAGTVKIGAVLPLTGVSAIYGQYPREGMQLALKEINDLGGLQGKKLEIIFEDSQSKPINAVTSIQKLINSNNVPVVLVGASSPETLAMAPIAEENKTVLLASGSAAPKIRDAGDYIFRLKVGVDKESDELMRFAFNELKAKTISILYVNNDYGAGVKEFGEKQFIELGGKVLKSENFNIEETDFRSYLLKIKETKPDVVLLAGWPRNMGQILKQARELNFETIFITPGGTIGPEIIEIAGNAADGLIYVMEFNLESEREETKRFREKFKQRYAKEPELFAAMGYDAVKIIAMLLKKCGENSVCIKNELYKIQNYQGASAQISFDDHGDVIKPMQFMTIKNSQFVLFERD